MLSNDAVQRIQVIHSAFVKEWTECIFFATVKITTINIIDHFNLNLNNTICRVFIVYS